LRFDTLGTITFFNEFAQSFFGYSESEIIGKNVIGTIVPETDSSGRDLVAMIRDLVQHPERFKNNENENMCRNGERVWVSWTNKAITDEDGNVVGILAIGNDITERRRLEDQLRQALKMEAIGTLAGGVAHDFNNLLMAIQGNASLMLLETDPSHPNYEKLKSIEQSVLSGSELTHQLLGFARGGKYEVKPTDLNELIQKTSGMFGRTRKEIRIHSKYQQDIWTTEVDTGQIEQVLLNLYVNAWHAMPGGGELYLETENVTVDEKFVKPYRVEPGDYVKISVTDSGIGMDAQTRQRVFEPFFTTKEMGRGTGLGLASVYGIVKNHGGFIDVYSERGHGTIFKIYLPASQRGAYREEEMPGDTLRGTETILLVDDEEIVLEVSVQLLKSLGYKVMTARSGREALDVLSEDQDNIDMVILDMIMPGMGGGETYDEMKGVDPNIRVLLSSGYSIDGQAREILDRGCNAFIQKPFNMRELSHKIREILDTKKGTR
jgi:PAS domain S-box-containing protein